MLKLTGKVVTGADVTAIVGPTRKDGGDLPAGQALGGERFEAFVTGSLRSPIGKADIHGPISANDPSERKNHVASFHTYAQIGGTQALDRRATLDPTTVEFTFEATGPEEVSGYFRFAILGHVTRPVAPNAVSASLTVTSPQAVQWEGNPPMAFTQDDDPLPLTQGRSRKLKIKPGQPLVFTITEAMSLRNTNSAQFLDGEIKCRIEFIFQ